MSESEPVVKKRRRDGAGFSIPAAAEEIGVSYNMLRDAIEMESRFAPSNSAELRACRKPRSRVSKKCSHKRKRPRRRPPRALCTCSLVSARFVGVAEFPLPTAANASILRRPEAIGQATGSENDPDEPPT